MSKKTNALSLALALVLLLGLFTGCAARKEAVEPADNSDVAGEVDTTKTEGKVLRIGELWAITDIDPSYDGTILKEKAMVVEVLCDVDSSFNLIPCLATEWTNYDENTWVFTIKQGVKFHDGTDLNADAVVWSLENAIKKDPTLVTKTKIDTITATGDYEVTIKTSEPNAEIPEYMHMSGLAIIAKSSYDANGQLITPVGTGPFKVESFDISTGVLTTVKNEDYYGTVPSIDKVTMTGMTDSSTRAMALESGEIDFTCDLPFNQLDYLSTLDNVKVEKYDTARVYCIDLNLTSELFKDKNVRHAISMAIDRETIANDVLSGCGSPCKSIYTDNMAWCDTTIDESAFDLEQAKQLMAEADWADNDGDGVLDKNGKPFEFTIITYTERPGLPLIAEALQAQLGELGIKVNVTTMENSGISEHISSGKEWGMYLSGSATCMTPSCVYFLNSKYRGDTNKYGYASDEMDALLDKCLQTFDTDERFAVSKEIQALAMDELPIIYVCNYGVAYGFSSKVTNFKFNPTAHDYMWNVDIAID